MDEYIKTQTPDDIEDLIIEVWNERIAAFKVDGKPMTNKVGYKYPEVVTIINDIASLHKKNTNQILRLLKRSGKTNKIGGINYYA